MKNQLWGYVKYLLLGILTVTTLLWSTTVTPVVASSLRHSGLDPESMPEILNPILRFSSYGGLTQVQDDAGKELILSLPFAVKSSWTSVSNTTPGIVWTTSMPSTDGQIVDSQIKFGIKNGQFIASANDTWFVYGWFGALAAIKQPYNVKYPEWDDRHNGIDFAGKEGIEIVSSSNGKITFAGKKTGNTVIIDAGGGFQITYAHLQNISVKKGQKIKVGDLIGHLGATGTTNPHLHFQVDYINGSTSSPLHRIAINPVPLFDAEWGNIVIPDAPANQFYTENQNPSTQPNFIW